MPPTRSVPKIAPGELPPPDPEKNKPSTLTTSFDFKSPQGSPKKSPVKYNCPGIEESDSEGDSDSDMIIEEAKPPLPSPPKSGNPNSQEDSQGSQGQKRKSVKIEKGSDTFEFDDFAVPSQPMAKKQKTQFSITSRKDVNKHLFPSKKANLVAYRHTWSDEDKKPEAPPKPPIPPPSTSRPTSSKQGTTSTQLSRQPSAPELSSRPQMKLPRPPSFNAGSRFGGSRQVQKCLESGERDDFTQDFEYFLTTIGKPDATENTQYLSLQSIVKKSVKIEFRNFLRKGNSLPRLLSAIKPQLGSPRICAATAVFLYFMARDRQCLIPNEHYTSLILPLLRVKAESTDKAFDAALKTLWPLLEEWATATCELINQQVNLGMTFESFNIPFLTLEGLALVCMHKHNPDLQKALFGNGCLQWIVAKVEKLTKKMTRVGNQPEGALNTISELNRCMRILETSALYNKQNQTYLMTCGNCSLLQSCVNLFQTFHRFASSENEGLKTASLDALCIVGRVLMNLTHDNELCCTKLGSINNFIELCLLTITEICPKFAPKDKKFDIILMACALIVNMTEKSAPIRKRVVDMTLNVYDQETKEISKEKTLAALTKLFVAHESAARTVDEEFDKELEFEDIPEDCDDETNGVNSDGRLHRGDDMNEEDAFRAMQAALSKVDSHMEDSVFASYLGLVLGCLIQRDSENASYVKSLLPGKTFTSLIEQLNRFKEFMEMTQKKGANLRTLERIVGALQGYNAL